MLTAAHLQFTIKYKKKFRLYVCIIIHNKLFQNIFMLLKHFVLHLSKIKKYRNILMFAFIFCYIVSDVGELLFYVDLKVFFFFVFYIKRVRTYITLYTHSSLLVNLFFLLISHQINVIKNSKFAESLRKT